MRYQLKVERYYSHNLQAAYILYSMINRYFYVLITHYNNVLPCRVTRIPEGDAKSPKNELLKFISLYTIVFICF